MAGNKTGAQARNWLACAPMKKIFVYRIMTSLAVTGVVFSVLTVRISAVLLVLMSKSLL